VNFSLFFFFCFFLLLNDVPSTFNLRGTKRGGKSRDNLECRARRYRDASVRDYSSSPRNSIDVTSMCLSLSFSLPSPRYRIRAILTFALVYRDNPRDPRLDWFPGSLEIPHPSDGRTDGRTIALVLASDKSARAKRRRRVAARARALEESQPLSYHTLGLRQASALTSPLLLVAASRLLTFLRKSTARARSSSRSVPSASG